MTISLPDIPASLENYCVYTGKVWDTDQMTDEHPIPLALAGNDSEFVIQVHEGANRKVNNHIDQPVIRDPIIMFGRRDADARGHHSQHVPIPKFRNARAFSSAAGHKSINDAVPGFKIEMAIPSPRVTHQSSKTVLGPGVFSAAGFITEFQRDDVALCRFAVKTLLGVGWRLFLKDLETALDAEALRRALDANYELTQPAPGDIRFLLEHQANGPRMARYVDFLKSAMLRKHMSTVMVCEHAGRLEWIVSCVGYYVAGLQMPINGSLLAPSVPEGERLVITFERHTHRAELLSPAAK